MHIKSLISKVLLTLIVVYPILFSTPKSFAYELSHKVGVYGGSDRALSLPEKDLWLVQNKLYIISKKKFLKKIDVEAKNCLGFSDTFLVCKQGIYDLQTNEFVDTGISDPCIIGYDSISKQIITNSGRLYSVKNIGNAVEYIKTLNIGSWSETWHGKSYPSYHLSHCGKRSDFLQPGGEQFKNIDNELLSVDNGEKISVNFGLLTSEPVFLNSFALGQKNFFLFHYFHKSVNKSDAKKLLQEKNQFGFSNKPWCHKHLEKSNENHNENGNLPYLGASWHEYIIFDNLNKKVLLRLFVDDDDFSAMNSISSVNLINDVVRVEFGNDTVSKSMVVEFMVGQRPLIQFYESLGVAPYGKVLDVAGEYVSSLFYIQTYSDDADVNAKIILSNMNKRYNDRYLNNISENHIGYHSMENELFRYSLDECKEMRYFLPEDISKE